MRAALEHLAERAGAGRRVAVLGEMAELGETAPGYHAEIGELVRELGVAGDRASASSRAPTAASGCATAGEAAARLRDELRPGRRRARQGLALGGTRGRRGELARLMARVLVAALVAMIIAILGGPTFIAFLRKNEFGQHIREEGPQHHAAKQGTPTMGGLLILLAATIAFLPLSRLHAAGADDLRHGARLRRRSASSTTTSSCATSARSACAAAGRCCCCSGSPPPSASRRTISSLRTTSSSRSSTSRLPLGPFWYVLAVPDHRRRRQRREPDRRRRRARRRAPRSSPSRRSPRWR